MYRPTCLRHLDKSRRRSNVGRSRAPATGDVSGTIEAVPPLRRRLASLALVAVLLLASVWAWVGTADDVGAWQRGRALDERGVDVAATVLDYSYDSNGGDPGGWTTDTVRFQTLTGESLTAMGRISNFRMVLSPGGTIRGRMRSP